MSSAWAPGCGKLSYWRFHSNGSIVPLRKSVVERGLRNKGFREGRSKDLMFRYYLNGRYTGCWTKVSHGADFVIGDNLVGQMKRQLRLQSSRQVRDFCECSLSLAQYQEILRGQGVLPRIPEPPPTSR